MHTHPESRVLRATPTTHVSNSLVNDFPSSQYDRNDTVAVAIVPFASGTARDGLQQLSVRRGVLVVFFSSHVHGTVRIMNPQTGGAWLLVLACRDGKQFAPVFSIQNVHLFLLFSTRLRKEMRAHIRCLGHVNNIIRHRRRRSSCWSPNHNSLAVSLSEQPVRKRVGSMGKSQIATITSAVCNKDFLWQRRCGIVRHAQTYCDRSGPKFGCEPSQHFLSLVKADRLGRTAISFLDCIRLATETGESFHR